MHQIKVIWNIYKTIKIEIDGMEMIIIPPEEIVAGKKRKKEDEKKRPSYGKKYRESLARRKGFKSYKEYYEYLKEKKEEKLEEIERRINPVDIIVIEEPTREELERLEREERLGILKMSERELCGHMRKIIDDVEDPESIFKDIDFVRKYTGCKIPTKEKINK